MALNRSTQRIPGALLRFRLASASRHLEASDVSIEQRQTAGLVEKA
jgi:hypothetical protein